MNAMVEKEVIVLNGVEIDKNIASHIISKILFDENINLRTKEKDDSEMVTQHLKTMKEAINAYQ